LTSEDRRCARQYLIAGKMSVLVVDRLESVKVGHNYAQTDKLPFRASNLPSKGLVECPTIG
jgi:hypothetical protein